MRQAPLKQLAITDILACSRSDLVGTAEGQLCMPSGGNVVVWRDQDAHENGLALIRRGMHTTNPALFLPLISCIVPSGTRAVTADAVLMAQDILVVGGRHAGYRGSVPVESFLLNGEFLDP